MLPLLQELDPFALMSSYRTFHAAVINIEVLKSSRKVPDIFLWF
jgi:hypothetical protein